MTNRPGEKIHLAAFNFSGAYSQSWRHPDVQPDGEMDIDWQIDFAKTAERGLFDMVFMADETGVARAPSETELLSRLSSVSSFEPGMLMAALAMHTRHIGLVYTMSTTYFHPYNVARQVASLDRLSGGRAGWNLVTSANPNEAFNFGMAGNKMHGDRYRRAAEFHDVVTGLWDSFDDDAFVLEQAQGRFFDPTRFRALDHDGEFFKVRGPLKMARPIQGHPIIAQAGASPEGKDLGARTADIVFCSHHFIDEGRAFREDMKARAIAYGRKPTDIKILPGISIVLGETRSEAEQRLAEISALYPDEIAIENITAALSLDVTGHDLDGPFPEFPQTTGIQGHQKAIAAYARRSGLSIRQTAQHLAASSKHRFIAGTPKDVADDLEAWFEAGAADGFVIMNPYRLRSLQEFVDRVVPELQRRGLFRTAYEGDTLRESLGVGRPSNDRAARADDQTRAVAR